jgi:type I site-specific restriction endonuclease
MSEIDRQDYANFLHEIKKQIRDRQLQASMIEFKQIIGRGTRLFDGKDYFTIYDFVKAYEHFNDPEWDGEPQWQRPSSRISHHHKLLESLW